MMYSTDDDLFSQRRVQKKWQRPSCAKPQEVSAELMDTKRRSGGSDDSSDDFANAKDPIWMKQQCRHGRSATAWQLSDRRAVSGEKRGKDGVVCASTESSDFGISKKKGRALLDRNTKTAPRDRLGTQRNPRTNEKETSRDQDICSSCSESTCGGCTRSPKRTTFNLLEKHRRRIDRPIAREPQQAKATKSLSRSRGGKPETTLRMLLDRISDGFLSSKQEIASLKKMIERCEERLRTDKRLQTLADETKEFIGGQLRKGIDKAVAAATIKLNERVRNESEVSNEKMELLMKVNCNKVQDMTDAYKGLADKLRCLSPGRRNCDPKGHLHHATGSQESRSLCDDLTRESEHDSALGIPEPYRGPDVKNSESLRGTRALDTVSAARGSHSRANTGLGSVHESVAPLSFHAATARVRQNSDPASAADISSLQRTVDDLEEKTQQCWLEISNVREIQTKRHRRTRQQLRQLAEDHTQRHAASQCKEKFVAGQIADLSKQLRAIEKSLLAAEEARQKADGRTSEIEVYATQIYEACKSTLKDVDLRYQKLKQCYREVRDRHTTVEAKCEALAEAVSDLYTNAKQRKKPSLKPDI